MSKLDLDESTQGIPARSSKLTVFSVVMSALVFAALIPILEINETHLLNPEWPAHARLHEAWQLLSNILVSLLAVVLVWRLKAPRLGIGLALIIGVSFLIAFLGSASYGGSMLHSDGTQMTVGGVNAAVLIVSALCALLFTSFVRESLQ